MALLARTLKMTNSVLDNPSIAGGVIADLYKGIAECEVKPQPRLGLLSALQAVSIAVGKAGGMSASAKPLKPTIYSMGIAPTGAGKDAGLSFLKRAVASIGVYYQTDIPSDKDIKFNFVREQGQYALIIDEMDSLVDKMKSKQSFESGIVASLLEMYTAKSLVISNKYKEEMIEKLKKDKERIAKAEGGEKKDGGIASGAAEVASKVLAMDGDDSLHKKSIALQVIDKKIDILENGMKNPMLNLHGVATPRAIASNLDSSHADRGFLGRFLIFDCPGRPEEDPDAMITGINDPYPHAGDDDTVFDSLKSMMRSIRPGMRPYYSVDCPELRDIKEDVRLYQDKMLSDGNDVCGRIYENWFRVSSLLAFSDMDTKSPNPKPVITAKHGEIARQIVFESVKSTMLITRGSIGDDQVNLSNVDLLRTHVLSKTTTSEGGVYVSKLITNILRSSKAKELVHSIYPEDLNLVPCLEQFILEMENIGLVRYTNENLNKVRRL